MRRATALYSGHCDSRYIAYLAGDGSQKFCPPFGYLSSHLDLFLALLSETPHQARKRERACVCVCVYACMNACISICMFVCVHVLRTVCAHVHECVCGMFECAVIAYVIVLVLCVLRMCVHAVWVWA